MYARLYFDLSKSIVAVVVGAVVVHCFTPSFQGRKMLYCLNAEVGKAAIYVMSLGGGQCRELTECFQRVDCLC